MAMLQNADWDKGTARLDYVPGLVKLVDASTAQVSDGAGNTIQVECRGGKVTLSVLGKRGGKLAEVDLSKDSLLRVLVSVGLAREEN
jgi:hypothetical protein